MSNLKNLELQRLIKELQFIESDYNYRSEIIKQGDKLFLESVSEFLEKFPELKNVLEECFEKKVPYIESSVSQSIELIEQGNISIKKLYRDIVKMTHPDKIKNKKLNELYIEATSAYENNDFVTIYKVSSDLLINFEFDDTIISTIKKRIEEYRDQILFLESTYTFRWLKSDENDKLKVILNFIENKIK